MQESLLRPLVCHQDHQITMIFALQAFVVMTIENEELIFNMSSFSTTLSPYLLYTTFDYIMFIVLLALLAFVRLYVMLRRLRCV